MTTTVTNDHHSRFHTSVRRVRRLPLWNSIAGWALVLANTSEAVTLLVDATGPIPAASVRPARTGKPCS